MDWDQWASLITLLYLFQMRIDLLLVKLFGREFRNDFWPDHTFLHEICIQARVSQLGDDLDELRVCMFGDI